MISGLLSAQSGIVYSAMALLAPGSSQIALGKDVRGAVVLGADLLTITAYLNTKGQINSTKDSYKKYAVVYAGVSGSHDEHYYQRLQDYFSSDDFNTYQEMQARNYFLIYNYDPLAFEEYMAQNTYSGDESWMWQSSSAWKKYKQHRRDHQKAKMNGNLFLGVLLLNRAFSVIDTAFIRKNLSEKTGSITLFPTSDNGFEVQYSIRF